MSESAKTADKCAKCGVTNPISFTKCRRCGKTLQWASGAAAQSAAPVSTDPLAAPPSALSSTRFQRSPSVAGKDAASIPSNALLPGELTTGAARPPQVYTGGPPSKLDDLPKEAPKNMTPYYAVGVVSALLMFFLVLRMISPRPVEAIAEMVPHVTKGKTFQSLAPKDAAWELHEGASADGLTGGSRWQNGSAQINIAADAAGSFMSEGMKNSAKSPQEALHEMEVRQYQEKYGNYEEDPSRKYTGGFGETWVCEFSGTGGMRVGKLHGLRATMLSNQMRLQFVATCREADWDKLKPSFDKILASISPVDSPMPTELAPAAAPVSSGEPSVDASGGTPSEGAPSG